MYLKFFATALLAAHIAVYTSAPNEQEFFMRPAKVQKAVDDAFEKNRTKNGGWLFNGSDYYTLMGIDEEMLINYLASLNNKHIYIMDVGCARAKWGKNLARMLRNKDSTVESTFHIFSITGGHECKQKSWQEGNVILHQLHEIKIENIDEELANHGFDLTNKVHLMVSSWTLRHLVDPFGTLCRMYTLLNPAGGKLLCNGFLSKIAGSEDVGAWGEYKYILAQCKNPMIFRDFYQCRDLDQFILERNNEYQLTLPLRYTGNIFAISGDDYQCAAETTTEFYETNEIDAAADTQEITPLDTKRGLYVVGNNQMHRDLYKRLKMLGLF